MGDLTLKVANRGKSRGIKKLPASIDVSTTTSIEEVKKLLAKQAGVRDFNRIGLFDPTTRKNIRDRKALVGDLENVIAAKELLVQDLGPQIAWRTVFVVEYIGPIFIHAALYYLHPIIPLPAFMTAGQTASRSDPLTDIQTLLFWLFELHYIKRELETLFLHRFSANTMPAFNIFRNSAMYWLSGGVAAGWSLYAPLSPFRVSATSPLASPPRAGFGSSPLDYVGLAFFVVGELCNFSVHYHLAHLRKPGSTERGIPNCIGSSLVTSPNYMFEVLSWLGVILISRDLTVVVFIIFGSVYMAQWSRDKERILRQQFPDTYKKKKYTMLPGLI